MPASTVMRSNTSRCAWLPPTVGMWRRAADEPFEGARETALAEVGEALGHGEARMRGDPAQFGHRVPDRATCATRRRAAAGRVSPVSASM
jgi:hypothetical protein